MDTTNALTLYLTQMAFDRVLDADDNASRQIRMEHAYLYKISPSQNPEFSECFRTCIGRIRAILDRQLLTLTDHPMYTVACLAEMQCKDGEYAVLLSDGTLEQTCWADQPMVMSAGEHIRPLEETFRNEAMKFILESIAERSSH